MVDMPGTPFRIFAFLGYSTVGDFIRMNVFAASVAKTVPIPDLNVYFFNDRPYKSDIFSLNHRANRFFTTEGGVFPFDWFDLGYNAPHTCEIAGWHDNDLNQPHVVLVPSMMGWLEMGGFDHPARLRLKDEDLDVQNRRLADLGVDPAHWFAVLHAKESGYKYRVGSGPARDVNPRTYEAAAHYIIDELGGQVVRLGDPTMTPWQRKDGLVDLTPQEPEFLLHACAVQSSRFVMASDSGMHPLGSAMGVPTAVTDLMSTALVWNPDDLILSKTVVTPDGQEFRQKDAFARGLLHEGVVYADFNVIDVTVDQLCGVAQEMHRRTESCSRWRGSPVDDDLPEDERTRNVVLPFEAKIRASWFE